MSLKDVSLDDLRQLGFDSYRDYLISEHFRGIRIRALNRDDWRCRYCGGPADHVKFLEFSLPALKGDRPGKVASICTKCYLP